MSRSQSLVLGPAVLGREAFLQQQASNALNSGSVGLGKALQQPFKANNVPEREPAMPPARARQLAEQDAQRKRSAEMVAEAAKRREEENRARVAKGSRVAGKIAKAAAKKRAKGASVPDIEEEDLTGTVSDEPADVSFSEAEVEALLAKDPLQWDVILAAEARRPDDARPAVARAVIGIVDKVADSKPIPAELVAELQLIAESKVE